MSMLQKLHLVCRLRRDRRAETAVEFALIGVAFFGFIMLIFTVSLDMFLQMTLDDATRNAARQVQVWGANGTTTTGASFVTAVCNEFGVVVSNCAANLQYSVQVAPSFAQMSTVSLQSDGNLSTTGQYGTWIDGTFTSNVIAATSEGTPEFMLVQVAYPVPFRLFNAVNGVATENGTTSLYSSAAVVVP